MRSPALDPTILRGNLVSGALWLLLLACLGAWPLALALTAYVVAAGVFLAAVYARDTLTRVQEAAAWAAPWLVAVALGAGLAATIEPADALSPSLLYFGLVIGTPAYLAWQLSALAVRQFLLWRSPRPGLGTAPPPRGGDLARGRPGVAG
ncbi:hypothetical protein [Nocardioides sp. zg-DK7169]|uniref:hypothetical protein n=1 Tax=Nocardioides sp. zg-DK7169 TaxID=2736600 RepID=UPI0015553BF6|nr:hypothetical protein [Nocardioides sp. zg-DK7169]NPC96734.1 hypothetical protein [Nocardioides sp. zg-DK7169]